ncbi:MAG: THUMP domain-containing class I SAM-dependent RNA methyltransferase [Bellilinea sp.]
MAAETPLELFAACLPGVEPYLAKELCELSLVPKPLFQTGKGGVSLTGSMETIYRANLWLRTANRILLRLGKFHALKFVELRRKAGNLPWERYLSPGQPVSIRTTCKHSKLYHSGGVTERVLGAIGDRLGRLPESGEFAEDQPSAQLVVVRFDHDECTISVDTSGEGLHRRGYRLGLAKAPLRETLAAALLSAAGWDRKSPLLDPFCGSGVIPIEAALIASHTAPGINRRFAFMDWPGFASQAFEEEKKAAAGARHLPSAVILGSDRDAGAILTARQNAERAGVADWVQFSQAAISAINPPEGPGWVVTNPPYGVRISASNDLRSLYAQFGNVLKKQCPGWTTAFLCNDDHLASLTRLKFEKGVSLNNGGIPVKLSIGKVLPK